MNRRRCAAALGGIWLLLTPLAAGGARTRAERRDYHGWKDAVRLSNGTVELVYVPPIGRIMRYGFVGGENVLWENAALQGRSVGPDQQPKEWVNYGGDKLWPAPQERWNWPPDPYLDRAPQQVTLLGDGRLRATGAVSPALGIRFEREITLDPTGTGATLKNTMVNAAGAPVEWSVWEVAQVKDPRQACLPVHRATFAEGYRIFPGSPPAPETISAGKERVCLRRHPEKGGKIGGNSPQGWAEAEVGALRFRVSAALERGKTYPDEGCAQEIWSNPDPLKYMELELLGPVERIDPGKRLTLTTHWHLTRS